MCDICRLMGSLLPVLSRLEPYDVLVGVHLRSGFADWQFRNAEASFRPSEPERQFGARREKSPRKRAEARGLGVVESEDVPRGREKSPSTLSPARHWRLYDAYLQATSSKLPRSYSRTLTHTVFWPVTRTPLYMTDPHSVLAPHPQDCASGVDGPCFNWESPHLHRAPSGADARSCVVSRDQRPKTLDAPDGVLGGLLGCAANLAEGLAAMPPAHAEHASKSSGGGRWGLVVLSDSPAFPSLAASLPALRGKIVTTDGAGRLGHSSFTKSCSREARGCEYGADPAGAWTRSVVDFYVAGCAIPRDTSPLVGLLALWRISPDTAHLALVAFTRGTPLPPFPCTSPDGGTRGGHICALPTLTIPMAAGALMGSLARSSPRSYGRRCDGISCAAGVTGPPVCPPPQP